MLTQQGTQRIEVVVRREGSASGCTGAREKNVDKVGSNDSENNWKQLIFGSDDPKRIKRVLVTNTTHFLAVTKQITGLALNYVATGVGQKYGDQAYQEAVQRQIEQVQDVTSIASSFAMGAVYGAGGVPIGSILGSVMNGIATTASIGFKYQTRERDFNYKQFKENNSIEYNRARAGINLTTGRLR